MAHTPIKKLKLNLGPMRIMLPSFCASMKQLALRRQNVMLLKVKPSESFQMDELFIEAFGSWNNAWRSAVYNAYEELGIDMDGKMLYIYIYIFVSIKAIWLTFFYREAIIRPAPNYYRGRGKARSRTSHESRSHNSRL